MAFWHRWVKGREGQTVVLIDIAADSVAGGYTHYRPGEPPLLLYTRRLPIEFRPREAHKTALMRALGALGTTLVAEGAPAAQRALGSGAADTVLVSIDAPWQEASVRTEEIERAEPFTFTKSLLETLLERTRAPQEGKYITNESIIGTILNGYETKAPFGKRVRRASVIVLTSYIQGEVQENIATFFRELYHTDNVRSIAASSLRYQAIRATFPHESEALLFDLTSSSLSIACIRHGYLVALREVSRRVAWIRALEERLTKLSAEHPLPRTIFLIAPEAEAASVRATLEGGTFAAHWLSEYPPSIIPVVPSHLVGHVEVGSGATPDLPLLLMALYYTHRT